MLYGEYCLNAELMLPYIKKLNSKNKFHFDTIVKESKRGEETMRKYAKLIGKKKDSSPLFIDLEKNKMIQASNAEDLMAWIIDKKDWWNYT